MLRSFLLALCSVCLCGCAGSRCLGDQPYSHAPSIPPLKSAENLKVPESSSALKIPPAPANPVPFGEKVKNEKGDEEVQCLDKPPPMPPVTDAKPSS